MGPLFAGLPWAPPQSYPAGAFRWSGTPVQLPPVGSFFTPSPAFAPSAQQLNGMFYQRDMALLSVAQQTLALDGINWPHALVPWTTAMAGGSGSPVMQGAPLWMPALGLWFITGIGSTGVENTQLFVSADGAQWSFALSLETVTGANAAAGGFVVRSTDAVVAVIGSGAIGWNVYLHNFQTNAAGHQTLLTGANIPALGANCWCSGTYFLGTTWVFWCGGSSTNAPMFTVSDATNFAAAVTWAPPAGFVIHNTAHIVSPTAILIFPSGTAVVTEYMRTTDGQNWAQVAMPALTGGEGVIDATYDSVSGVYYMLTGAAAFCRIWTSSTGLAGSWTVTASIAHQGFALKANGPELLVWIHLALTGLAIDMWRALQSTDGGFTWYFTQLMDTVAPAAWFSLRTNGTQFLYSNTSFSASGCSGAKLTQQLF